MVVLYAHDGGIAITSPQDCKFIAFTPGGTRRLLSPDFASCVPLKNLNASRVIGVV